MPWTFWTDLFFLWYFSAINVVYTLLLFLGMIRVYLRRKELNIEDFTNILHSNSLPTICFIIPMYNEEQNISATIQNILHLTYRSKQIIAVNDGSDDDTLQVLKREYKLVLIPQFYQESIPTEQVKQVYRSQSNPELIVIDKRHQGKYDTLNAGLNACEQPFFLAVDADSFIDDATFEALVRPILGSAETVAIGATIRVRNGCTLEYNRIDTKKFPNGVLTAMQGLEYLRSFLMRQGWDWIGGNFVIAGAFSIFSTELIRNIGGFSSTAAEDVEIVIRLHRVMRESRLPYRIVYLPDPVSWTEAPSTLKTLGKQRTRWHYGLLESIWYHKKLCFNPFYGLVGFITYPFMIWGEALEPIVEIGGYLYILTMWFLGILNIPFFILFLLLSFGFTFFYSLACLLIEELSFRKYPSFKSIASLLACCLIENFGYRQFNACWKARGFFRFFRNFIKVNQEARRVGRLISRTAIK